MIKRFHSRRNGVTLVELTIVAVLASVLAAMAVPRWLEYIPQMRTKAAVKDVVSTLREARSMAISRKVPFGVYFNAEDGSYVLFEDKDAPGNETFASLDSVITVSPVGTDVEMKFSTFPDNAVFFNPDGSASLSGTVMFESANYQTQYTVEVWAATGRVRMVEGYSFIETQ
ncbi:MAG: hypothetical protein Kow0074_05110 [Candidatus Zixiibacteriota bacterium]